MRSLHADWRTPSERIQGLWKMLCNEEEVGLVLAMPGTVDELAAKTGLPRPE